MDFTEAAEQEKPETQGKAVAKLALPLGDMSPVKKGLAQHDKVVAKIEKEVGALVVKDRESGSRAVELAGGAKTLYKDLKKAQDNLTDEANSYVKNVRNLFRPYLERLKMSEDTAKGKAAAFEVQERMAQQKREAEAREEARKLQAKIDEEARIQREAAEAKAREAAEKLKTEQDAAARAILEQTVKEETEAAAMEVPQVVIPVVTPQQTVTRTETGSGHLRMDWVHEVVDPMLVPRKYLIVDDRAIRADVKAGIREIPGCRIFEKPIMNIRT